MYVNPSCMASSATYCSFVTFLNFCEITLGLTYSFILFYCTSQMMEICKLSQILVHSGFCLVDLLQLAKRLLPKMILFLRRHLLNFAGILAFFYPMFVIRFLTQL